MDRRFITVLGVSLLFALLVSSVFYQMTSSGSPTVAAPVEEADIVVATRPLSVGVMIKPADVKLAKISTSAFPAGAFSKVEEVLDRPVISNILLDEPVIEGRLAQKGAGVGLAPTIPVGMRATTVRVNDVAGVAGFVMPGMRVDVLVTGNPPNGNGTITNTVLQNMQVLSAGTQIAPDGSGQPIQTPTVTLLATPEQAELLTLANSQGQIQLVLRNSSDEDIAETKGSDLVALYGAKYEARQAPTTPRPAPRPVAAPAPPPPAPVAPPPPPPPPPAPEIVVFRGTQRTVEVVSEAHP